MSKAVQTFTGGAWTITFSNRFVYDGWNLLAELNATNNTSINSFVWGLDLIKGSVNGIGIFVSPLSARFNEIRLAGIEAA